jgi:hypothetical protein
MRRLATVLTVTFLAASGLLAGCGGSDEQSDQATTTAAGGGNVEQGGSAAAGSGSAASFCDLSNELDKATSDPASATASNPEFIAVTERVMAGAPVEIKDSVALVIDTYTTKGFTAESMKDPKVAQASQEIATWLNTNCNGPNDGDGASNDSDGDDN